MKTDSKIMNKTSLHCTIEVKYKYVEMSLLSFAIKNGNLETIKTMIEEKKEKIN